ncbi:DUF2298 domain-containing protein [Kiritimatiellaeota bacterium B1221]|nr:DUF2298 domain-containing protein [Kiritimatiellaeota bacterium B1221]
MYLLAAQLWWRTGLFEIRFVWAFLLMACVGLSGRKLFFKAPTPGFGTRARMRKSFLQGWVIFTVLFWYWAGVRSTDPGVAHTEQPMDLMWMRAAMASHQPPIQDAWFGGAPSSYYSDGHQALAFLGVKLGLPIQESVNYSQIIWFALTGLLAFQAGKALYELSANRGRSLAGTLALLFTLFSSNPMGFISAIESKASPWWWSASRAVHDGEVELITEFPFFSFWLGDNHAHLIGLPFLLLSLLCAVSLFRARRIEICTPLLSFILIFWSWRINPWQVPTVLTLPLIALWIRKRSWTSIEWRNLALAVLPSLLLIYPIQHGGPAIELVINQQHHTNIMEALKVFGFFMPGILMVFFVKNHRFWLYLMALVAGMFLCAEIVFLKDLFYNRMNTVFKVYYQVWILAGILTALGLTGFVYSKNIFCTMRFIPLWIIFIPSLTYAGRLTIEAWRSPYRSLNAWSRESHTLQSALYIANHLIQPGDKIAEAPGSSYDVTSSKFGTWTAGNSIIGWTGHEQQWRPYTPQPDLTALYEAPSKATLQLVIQDLQLDWIILGERELNMFEISEEWESWIQDLSYRAVDQPDLRLYQIR